MLGETQMTTEHEEPSAVARSPSGTAGDMAPSLACPWPLTLRKVRKTIFLWSLLFKRRVWFYRNCFSMRFVIYKCYSHLYSNFKSRLAFSLVVSRHFQGGTVTWDKVAVHCLQLRLHRGWLSAQVPPKISHRLHHCAPLGF